MRPKALHLLDNIFALKNLSKNHVLAIEPLGFSGAEEKLGTVGVGPSIGHGKNSRPSVLQDEVLILKLVSVDRLSSSAVSSREVSALAHEVGDDTMEGGSLEPEPLLSSAQSTEVLTGLGNNISSQLHNHLGDGGTVSGDIKEYPWSAHDEVIEGIEEDLIEEVIETE